MKSVFFREKKVQKSQLEIIFPRSNKKAISDIIRDLSKQITSNPRFSLGDFSSVLNFNKKIRKSIFGDSPEVVISYFGLDIEHAIRDVITQAFNTCNMVLPIKSNIVVYVLPTQDRFTREYLDGINALAIGKTTILIYMSPLEKNWRRILRETFAHEYAHLISAHHVKHDCIRASMVYEGLAENFREFVMGGRRAIYVKTFTKKQALIELDNIDNKLIDTKITDKNYTLFLDYMFGNDTIPKWYGYSLGYWFIYELIHSHNKDIKSLFKISPKKIFQ